MKTSPCSTSSLPVSVRFSGCLAVLALSGQRWLGAIVPIGGVLMLAGWLALAFAGLTRGD